MRELTVWTIGHSTRQLDELLGLLQQQGIERLIDVRRFPTSKRFPHFEKESLESALGERRIAYEHVVAMGGYRGEPRDDSLNGAWRSAGFQAYADHALGDEFRQSLHRLVEHAEEERIALMCAEITPWRCHRQIIADHLVARGIRVIHIVAEDRVEEHQLGDHARVTDEGTVVYPPKPDDQPSLFDGPGAGG